MNTRIWIILSLSVATTISTPTESKKLLLTPYIKEKHLKEARDDSAVNASLFLNVTSHSGFLTVDEKHGSNMFFWYFPVAGKPVNETPWIVWLQGGPGASSLFGLFDEIGPFEYDGQLNLRQWSWTANYSVVFIDNPVGAGFSYTNSQEGYVKNMDEFSSNLYNALQQFLTIFPKLREAPLYIAGESYAGRYVPAIGYKILEKQPSGNTTINLKGLMMGNPVIDRIDSVNISSVYYHWGLLDTQGLLAAKPLQDEYFQAVQDNDVDKAYKLRNELLDFLDEISQKYSSYNLLKDSSDVHAFEDFIKKPEIRNALHVGDAEFSFSNSDAADALKSDFLTPLRPKVEKLLEKYKIMVYCGQLDLVAPCELGAESRRTHWHWSGREDFLKASRKPWAYNGTLAGYVKQGGGFTEVLVSGAGHMVPMDAPAHATQLITTFITDSDFPIASGFRSKPDYTPIIEEQSNTVTDHNSTVTKHNNTVTEHNNTVAQHNSTVTQHNNTVTKGTTPVQMIHSSEMKVQNSTAAGGVLALSIVINVILAIILVIALACYLKWRWHRGDLGNSRVYYTPWSTD